MNEESRKALMDFLQENFNKGCRFEPLTKEAKLWNAAVEWATQRERERCAVRAWSHYMKTCLSRKMSAASNEHWCSAKAIRAGTEEE